MHVSEKEFLSSVRQRYPAAACKSPLERVDHPSSTAVDTEQPRAPASGRSLGYTTLKNPYEMRAQRGKLKS